MAIIQKPLDTPRFTDLQPRILAISSLVSVGHVGLSAIAPTLHALGLAPSLLPTVVLSNHPGFPHRAATVIPPSSLLEMAQAIASNNWLGTFDCVLTGYLPTKQHVAAARQIIEDVRKANPAVRIICDPVSGDDPTGLYIDRTAAAALRNDLLPVTDVLLPNRFELAFLSGKPVTSPADARVAASQLQPATVIAKSIPLPDRKRANMEITADHAAQIDYQHIDGIPNGTGDMFSALIAAGWQLPQATMALTTIAKASVGYQHLSIIETVHDWTRCAP